MRSWALCCVDPDKVQGRIQGAIQALQPRAQSMTQFRAQSRRGDLDALLSSLLFAVGLFTKILMSFGSSDNKGVLMYRNLYYRISNILRVLVSCSGTRRSRQGTPVAVKGAVQAKSWLRSRRSQARRSRRGNPGKALQEAKSNQSPRCSPDIVLAAVPVQSGEALQAVHSSQSPGRSPGEVLAAIR